MTGVCRATLAFVAFGRQVAEASAKKLKYLRELERTGVKNPTKNKYVRRVVSDMARAAGVSRAYAFDARRVARKFTEQQIEEFIEGCVRHELPPCREYLKVLCCVPVKERSPWIDELLAGHWAAGELKARIQLTYGKRKYGGPPRSSPHSLAEAVVRLARMRHQALAILHGVPFLVEPGDPFDHREFGRSQAADAARTKTQAIIGHIDLLRSDLVAAHDRQERQAARRARQGKKPK